MTGSNNNDWINRSDEDGFTALHHAAKDGRVYTVSFLLDKYAQQIDLNKVDNKGFTPLYWALKNNHNKVSEVLIKNDATIEENAIKELVSQKKISDKKIIQLLLFTHRVDSPEIMYFLLQYLMDQGSWHLKIHHLISLFCRAASSAPKNFKSLLRRWPELTTKKDTEGYTSLHWLSLDLIEIQHLLLQTKNTEAINLLNSTKENVIKAIHSLINKGANINQTSPDGYTARALLENAGEAGREILKPKQCQCCIDSHEHIIGITENMRRFTI